MKDKFINVQFINYITEKKLKNVYKPSIQRRCVTTF